MDSTPRRRRVLQATGTALLAGIAGCGALSSNDSTDTTSSSTTRSSTSTPSTTTTTTGTTQTTQVEGMRGPRQGQDLPSDPDPQDGYPPQFDTTPRERSVDPSSFETMERSGQTVRLVPVKVAYYWYARHDARFADARSHTAYGYSHVFGAVSGPAEDLSGDSPVLSWPTDDRIVAYCDCPHHLSSLLAADLQQRGYTDVYAIDEGYRAWRSDDYPIAGSDVTKQPDRHTVLGRTPQRYAGGDAMLTAPDTRQVEGQFVQSDGSYRIDFAFYDVDADTTLRLETPAYTVTDTLGRLTTGRVGVDGTIDG